MTGVLELSRVSSGYGDGLVLRDVDLRIEPGEILALLGKNGMGKSTLLKTIMGFLPARTGRIVVDGRETTGLAPNRIVRRSVSYTPQDQALFPDLTVMENFQLVVTDADALQAGLDRMAPWFPVLGQRLRQRAGTLSGGEQKMLLMVRALLPRHRLMLMDEISEGLQPTMIKAISAALRAERSERSAAMLLVEQNVAFACEIADHFAILKGGEIVASGRIGEPGARSAIEAHLSV
jgi:branched-chain amino acid transport system ATP-binding protein